MAYGKNVYAFPALVKSSCQLTGRAGFNLNQEYDKSV
jgi:hypothetical protein